LRESTQRGGDAYRIGHEGDTGRRRREGGEGGREEKETEEKEKEEKQKRGGLQSSKSGVG
jgi:hypothetical protein